MTVDFAAVKLVPIASVLAHYKVQVRKRSNTEQVCRCPLPSHAATEHKNNNETFCISVEKGKWYCQADTCRAAGNHPKGGDVIDLVCRLDNSTPLEAAKKIGELFAVGNGKIQTDTVRIHPAEDVNKPLAFVLKDVNPAHEFIQSRGITVETAVKFNVGYFSGKGSMSQRVVFPCYENGSLVAYIGRTILEVSDDNPKWKVPLGMHRTFLYGLEKCSPERPLILAESPWAPLHFWLSAGIRLDPHFRLLS
jgi:hypothetical protein